MLPAPWPRRLQRFAWIVWLCGVANTIAFVVFFTDEPPLSWIGVGLTLIGLVLWLTTQIILRKKTAPLSSLTIKPLSLLALGVGLAGAAYRPACVAPHESSMPHFPLYPAAQDICFEYSPIRSVFGPAGKLHFTTADSPAQVIAFYRPLFPKARIVQQDEQWLLEDRQRPNWQQRAIPRAQTLASLVHMPYHPPLSSTYWTTTIQVTRQSETRTTVNVTQNVVFCGLGPDGPTCSDDGPDRAF